MGFRGKGELLQLILIFVSLAFSTPVLADHFTIEFREKISSSEGLKTSDDLWIAQRIAELQQRIDVMKEGLKKKWPVWREWEADLHRKGIREFILLQALPVPLLFVQLIAGDYIVYGVYPNLLNSDYYLSVAASSIFFWIGHTLNVKWSSFIDRRAKLRIFNQMESRMELALENHRRALEHAEEWYPGYRPFDRVYAIFQKEFEAAEAKLRDPRMDDDRLTSTQRLQIQKLQFLWERFQIKAHQIELEFLQSSLDKGKTRRVRANCQSIIRQLRPMAAAT